MMPPTATTSTGASTSSSPSGCPTSGWSTAPSPIRCRSSTSATRLLEPTNNWANENQIYTFSRAAAAARAPVFFTRWMFKLMGLYQLPWDLNISGTVSGHEGTFYDDLLQRQDWSLPNRHRMPNQMPHDELQQPQNRLADVCIVNLKLEKMLKARRRSPRCTSPSIASTSSTPHVLRTAGTSTYGHVRDAARPTMRTVRTRAARTTRS